MADFDDLLSSTRRTTSSIPVFDNPFQDVFDGVSGRPRSPDPWSTGGWGEPDPFPAATQRIPTPPISPGGFREFSQVHAFEREEPTPDSPVAEPAASTYHQPEPATEPERPPLDPLASDLQDDDDLPIKRNPLGPLPPAPKLPPLQPTPAPAKAAEPPKEEPPQAATEETESIPASPAVVAPTPTSASTETPEHPPTIDLPDQTLATNGTRFVPAIPSSPLTPHLPTPSTSSGFSNDSIRDRASLAPSESVKYDRIVSPLDTPTSTLVKRTSLEQGFSNLALGGEAPGWGGFSQPYPSEPPRDSTTGGWGGEAAPADTFSTTQSESTVKEEDTDQSEVRG